MGTKVGRTIGRLSALAVSRAKMKGLYHDGGGLYLQVSASGARSWVYRYMLHGKAREMGLGSLRDVSLAHARDKVTEFRRLRADGIDPIERRRAERHGARLEAAKAITFKDCAEAYIEGNKAGWGNPKHVAQWSASLQRYAYPVFGSLSVQAVDTALVMKVLEPIWSTKTETASRVRGRIESVLDWARARGYREGENPARWRGHIENLLPARSRVRTIQHHPALPYEEIGTFIESLAGQDGLAAKALEFLILTAARTGEVVGALWDEIDLEKRIWTVPAHRIKARREHRVPLSSRTMAILRGLHDTRNGEFVFTVGRGGQTVGRGGQPLSNMALLSLLKRMGRTDLTAHGFRSTFRDWAAERTNYPRDVAEMALAHAVSDKVEAAYRRGDLFEKRRRMMDEWARYCGTVKPAARVIAIGATR